MLYLFRNSCYVITILFVSFSCSTDRSKNVAAKIGSEEITYDRVDQLINEELYQSLFEIYYKRKIALDELVANQLLEKEGKTRGISSDSLLQIVVNQKMKTISIDSFAQVHALKGGVPHPSNPLEYLPFNSPEAQSEIKRVLSIKLTDDFVSQLKTKYGVEIMLLPPKVPRKNLVGIQKEVEGNQESKMSLTVISDIDCSSCAEFQPVLELLKKKYADKLKFEHISLTTMTSLKSVLGEYAFKRGKYSELASKYYSAPESDSLELVRMYERVMNEKWNSADIESVRKSALNRAKALQDRGIVGTPTLLVNNRIYYGLRTVEAISEFIENQERY